MDASRWIHDYGYWAVAVFCFLEGETVLVLAGLACQQGRLEFARVVAIAAACGWTGDQCFFWIGRHAGPELITRWPAIARKAERVQRLIEDHADGVILLVRFAYGLRIAGPVIIGTTRVRARRFALFNAIGAMAWAPMVAGTGWAFGSAIQRLLGALHDVEIALAAALVAVGAVAMALGRRLNRK